MPYLRTGDTSGLEVKGVSPIAWGPGGRAQGVRGPGHLVGRAGRINVGLVQSSGERDCDINANDVKPSEARRVLLQSLSAMPEKFAPAASPAISGSWPVEDNWCAAAPGTDYMLLSTASDTEQGMPRVLLSVGRFAKRSDNCDPKLSAKTK